MDAKDVMIGDLISCKSIKERFAKITEIYKQLDYPFKQMVSLNANGLRYCVTIDEIEAIPLTEEILKANGFEDKSEKARYGSVFYGLLVGNVSITFEVDNGLPILTIEDTADRSSQHNVICLKDEIYNVHQLQLALRLCGLNELADNFKV